LRRNQDKVKLDLRPEDAQGLDAFDVGMRLNSRRASNSDQAKIVSLDPTVQANPVAHASPRQLGRVRRPQAGEDL
jgi:hypothetical protein